MAAARVFSSSTLVWPRQLYAILRSSAQRCTKNIFVKEPSLMSRTSSTCCIRQMALISYPLKVTHLQESTAQTRSMYQSIQSLAGHVNRPELLPSSVGVFVPARCITMKSKLGKRKTCKAVAKRFLRTGKGKLKRWKSGKNHRMMCKRKKRRRQLRKPTYVNKQQLKLLNKMLNGW